MSKRAEQQLPAAVDAAKASLEAMSKTSASFASPPEAADTPATTRVQGWPVFRATEVAKHKDASNRIWVTWKDSVYDVTDFVAMHPGGNRIMLAAGAAVDPYWAIYQQHNKDYVLTLLERYKIGLLHPEDVQAALGQAQARAKEGVADPYSNDPARHPALQVRSARPFNAEPPGPLLVDNFVTPTDLMFVRNHMPVPDVKEEGYSLAVVLPGRDGTRTVHLSLADLKAKFPKVQVTAALQCAGNRRADMASAKLARGLGWQTGAIANVTWGGARLIDVLRYCGVDTDEAVRSGTLPGQDPSRPLSHVQLEGLDSDAASATAYGASVPVDYALNPRLDAVLAYEMNGQALTRDHGFPVRAVFPGLVGARQVKWLGKIVLSPDESPSLWQQKDYKTFGPWEDIDKTNYGAMPAMQDMPVTSAIADPAPGVLSLLPGQTTIPLRGWAWSGGGRAISRVEVTTDGGKTWAPAEITEAPKDTTPSRTRSFGWTLWSAEVPAPSAPSSTSSAQPLSVAVRAMDVASNSQPADPLQVWNWRGLANNSWHTVNLELRRPDEI